MLSAWDCVRPALVRPDNVVSIVGGLSGFGANTAIVADGERLTYAELVHQVAKMARRLGFTRRLTLVAMSNTVASVVGYLAALAAGHAVILADARQEAEIEALIERFDPDTVTRPDRDVIKERYDDPAHDLYPDLALLLATSGSTGSTGGAKLVRLSYENVHANAAAIVAYLSINETDRAVTTLPLHHCYGLSVLHSHLLRGASVLVTQRTVTDPGLWELARRYQITSFAGVPHTFEQLDRIGFANVAPRSLLYITQAGDPLAPDRVKRWAQAGSAAGWQFFVMYGQTEATARMAYLPPDLAADHPGAIGIPIPGGALRLEPDPDWPDDDTGELVYTGPNVMLGYAEGPGDLACGRDVDELRTGDIGRRTDSGLYEIVGRRGRLVKLLGLRIDLRRVESALAEKGIEAVCVGGGEFLVVAVQGAASVEPARRVVGAAVRLPATAVRLLSVDALPRLGNGKPDYQALLDQASGRPPSRGRDTGTGLIARLKRLFAG
ncbi:MAG TPA: AMP-binding protein [Candidatus Limnocylindrales bacterium]|nr:AMP-binding protein [Candidatus Limnocylindrales bacterium]